jgi:hypothetical protein
MNSSEAKRKMVPEGATHDSPLRFTSLPRMEPSSFIAGWTKDIGAVSRLAADYLI